MLTRTVGRFYMMKRRTPNLCHSTRKDSSRLMDPLTQRSGIPGSQRSDSVDGASLNPHYVRIYGTHPPFPSICPGRYMTMNGTLIAVASLLATFNIERACKEEGVPVSKEVKMSSGLQSFVWSCLSTTEISKWMFFCDRYPYPFECKITPRSSAAIKLVVESVSDE